MQALPRQEIIRRSLADYGAVIVCRDMEEAVAFANRLAPEHLEVMCSDPMSYIGRLDNAGSVFLGKYSPEPLGDYYAGPNHVLPTSGTARFFSPCRWTALSRSRASSVIIVPLWKRHGTISYPLPVPRGLDAHAHAVAVRFEREQA